MPTDTSEKGLERLICVALTGAPCDPAAVGMAAELVSPYGGAGYVCGNPADYDREYCVDLAQLAAFLKTMQPKIAEALDLGEAGPTRRTFLARLQGEISKRGVIDVLRHGVKHGAHNLDLLYGTPRLATLRRWCSLRRTGSASRGSFATAATKRSVLWCVFRTMMTSRFGPWLPVVSEHGYQ